MSNFHKHKCPTCSWVWEHDPDGLNFWENKKAHTCIKCGDLSWVWYKGDDLAYTCWDPLKKPSIFKRFKNVFQF